MKIVIDIPDVDQTLLVNNCCGEQRKEAILSCVKNGTPLDSLPDRKKGEWIKQPNYKEKFERVYWQCNVCQEYMCAKDYYDKYVHISFCPNCGADMRGGKST